MDNLLKVAHDLNNALRPLLDVASGLDMISDDALNDIEVNVTHEELINAWVASLEFSKLLESED
jgi:hypothetical protein